MEEVVIALFKAGELAFDFDETIHRKLFSDETDDDQRNQSIQREWGRNQQLPTGSTTLRNARRECHPRVPLAGTGVLLFRRPREPA